MTPRQFRRWRNFSIRMARHGWRDMTRARRRKVAAGVADLIDYVSCNGVENIIDWDSSPVYVCDRVSEWITNRGYWSENPRTGESWDHRFADQISACVRAGLDVASAPSCGVLGFDVDDLRRMYRGKLPQWIATWFTTPITDATPGTEGVWL